MNHVRKIVIVMLVLAVALCVGSSVRAQDSGIVIENVPNIFGVAVGMAPDYQGSDDYQGAVGPFGRYTFPNSERYVGLIATELYSNLLDHPYLRLGPAINYRFGRDDGIDDEVVQEMEEIDGTLEGGLVAGLTFVDRQEPRKRFITTVEFLHDIGDAHEGYTLSLSARYWYPMSQAVDITIGAGLTYADDDYMSTYFGVSGTDSVRTGLPVFDAGGGIKDFRIIPGVVVHLSRSWHVGAGVRYQRLLSDAKDSPVVDERGSADQWIAGLALAYSW
jgi:outer membrane protein